jgi:hypothetical protein
MMTNSILHGEGKIALLVETDDVVVDLHLESCKQCVGIDTSSILIHFNTWFPSLDGLHEDHADLVGSDVIHRLFQQVQQSSAVLGLEDGAPSTDVALEQIIEAVIDGLYVRYEIGLSIDVNLCVHI